MLVWAMKDESVSQASNPSISLDCVGRLRQLMAGGLSPKKSAKLIGFKSLKQLRAALKEVGYTVEFRLVSPSEQAERQDWRERNEAGRARRA